MRLKVITCQPVKRELYYLASKSENIIDIENIDMKYHEEPKDLTIKLQEIIDNTSGYDYLLLCFGLCSKATVGLVAKNMPIVLIKAHDCITFLLGSRSQYSKTFSENPGTYFYSSGWLDHYSSDIKQKGGETLHESIALAKLKEYTEKYGAENAEFLVEQEMAWIKNYRHALFIDTDIISVDHYNDMLDKIANKNNWSISKTKGDLSILQKFIDGNWDSDFLIVNPNEEIFETYDENIISKRII